MEIRDKNKSTFKLKNFGPVYYLNLDDHVERREYMEEQFKYWEITNYEGVHKSFNSNLLLDAS